VLTDVVPVEGATCTNHILRDLCINGLYVRGRGRPQGITPGDGLQVSLKEQTLSALLIKHFKLILHQIFMDRNQKKSEGY
jgi:hypothetical protein